MEHPDFKKSTTHKLKMSKTEVVFAFLVAAVLAGVFLTFNSSSPKPALPLKESFMQQPLGMPVGQGMGPYDNTSVDGVTGWLTGEPHSAAPIGAGLPSQSETHDLNLMVGNRTDASCCPSAFTSDTGCVCLSEGQKNLFASRAGNRA